MSAVRLRPPAPEQSGRNKRFPRRRCCRIDPVGNPNLQMVANGRQDAPCSCRLSCPKTVKVAWAIRRYNHGNGNSQNRNGSPSSVAGRRAPARPAGVTNSRRRSTHRPKKIPQAVTSPITGPRPSSWQASFVTIPCPASRSPLRHDPDVRNAIRNAEEQSVLAPTHHATTRNGTGFIPCGRSWGQH